MGLGMARWMLSLISLLLPAGPDAAAVSSPARSVPAVAPKAAEVVPTRAAPVVAPAPAEKRGTPLRIPGARSLLIAPHGCEGLERKFDLLVHFHGAYTTVEPQLMQSGIDALYVVVNLGIGSGAYEEAFASKTSLTDYIESIRTRINQKCGGIERSVARVALSGWSAGYGGIYRALARPADADRIDAVLLADGMHVGFETATRTARTPRTARAAAMEPFRAFAERAGTGEKLMAVTHSAIVPPGYASTTLTASFLVDALHADSKPLTLPPPRADMQPTRRAERGSLFIDGYAGGDAPAHCTHLYAIGATLWSRLQARWSRPR
jgi:hypothetical protein